MNITSIFRNRSVSVRSAAFLLAGVVSIGTIAPSVYAEDAAVSGSAVVEAPPAEPPAPEPQPEPQPEPENPG